MLEAHSSSATMMAPFSLIFALPAYTTQWGPPPKPPPPAPPPMQFHPATPPNPSPVPHALSPTCYPSAPQESLNPVQSKSPLSFIGCMQPHPSTQHHPAFDLLLHYATDGCPVDCSPPWSLEHLQAAIKHGAHPSVQLPEARVCLHAKAMEKVSQGYACLIPWSELTCNPPPNLKISPLATVPHKSFKFNAILDLSFQLHLNGLRLPSVNSATKPCACAKAMQ